MTVVVGPCSAEFCVVYVAGPLRAPIGRELGRSVRHLLHRGERAIVLDLAEVTRIDAAGVGELVRAYNMTVAVDGLLRVVNAAGWAGEVLKRVGLFDLLSADVDLGEACF